MKTEFLSINDKCALLDKPNTNTIIFLLEEINRLENVVKAYENGITMINSKLETNLFKSPDTIDSIKDITNS